MRHRLMPVAVNVRTQSTGQALAALNGN